jgi:glycerol-1-phosphate dehydrogenase [NAD(P)+]
MFYNHISIPIILEISPKSLVKVENILHGHNLYFERKILITEEKLFELYKQELEVIKFGQIIFVKKSTLKQVIKLDENIIHPNSLIIGFGGGMVLDVVKQYASNKMLPYITIPSTLSNDGIYSPVARLLVKGKKKSFSVRPPLGIIADIDIIRKSPEINLMAGIGDLTSNFSALDDWDLAMEDIGEGTNDFAYSLSLLAAKSIKNYKYEELRNDDFLRTLTYGLVISGLAMVISGDTRPSSGSEHLISHAIDDLFPERSTLHGLQVAWGLLLVEERFRKVRYEKTYNFFRDIGLMKYLDELINFTEEEIELILKRSITIRNRYTILNKFLE